MTDDGNQIWHQDSPGILGAAETDDKFGRALASGDFDGDGVDDLAVGVHLEDIDGTSRAGAVNVLYGSAPTPTPPAEPGETGDVDKDGDVDVFDALAILNALVGIEPLEFPDNGDVNSDGTTNIFDALAVLGIVVSAP